MNKELFGSCFYKGNLRTNSKMTAQALAHITKLCQQTKLFKQNETN